MNLQRLLYDAETARVAELQRDATTARRPMGWQLDQRGEDGERWFHVPRGLTVIWSVAREQDGRVWLHASMAGTDRIPTWEELKELKAWLIAGDQLRLPGPPAGCALRQPQPARPAPLRGR